MERRLRVQESQLREPETPEIRHNTEQKERRDGMSANKQRRTALKRRARELSTAFFIRILLAVAAVLFVVYLLPYLLEILSQNLFGSRYEVPLFGYPLSVPSQLLLLLSYFITAPLQLALVDYMITLVRDYKPMKFLSLFDWLGDSGKLQTGMKYALWQILLTMVLFPFVFFPFSFLLDYREKVVQHLNDAISQGAKTIMDVKDLPAMDLRLTLLMAALFVMYLLSSALFFAVPYILVENPSVGIFSAARRSLKVIASHMTEFILFILSFMPYLILVFVTQFLAAPFVLPYYYTALALFIQKIRTESGDRPHDEHTLQTETPHR